MTPSALAHAENRADLARRLTHEILRRAAELHVETDTPALISFFRGLTDADRFRVWRMARASRCPSQETWIAAEKLLLARVEGC